MKVHRQTHRRRVSDNDVREILRGQMRTGRPTNAATIRGLGIACGSCRLSRLRREVKSGLATGVPRLPVAPESVNHTAAAHAFAVVQSKTGTGGEAPDPAAATTPVSQPGDGVDAGSSRPALVGEPRRAAAIPRSGHIRGLLGRVRCAAQAFWAALSRPPFSRGKAPSLRPRSGPAADQPSQPWPRFLCGFGRKFGL